jgi:REP element-mobilizing transposase RayT
VGRPIRQFAAAKYWFVTDRCDEERFLLRPEPEVNAILRQALREAIEATGVGVLALCVMGNHWHLVLRAGDAPASISAFMQRLKSDVAVAVNQLRERRGGFWADRYHAQPILDDASLIARILYTLLNPVAAGLAATAAEYPGLSSLGASLGVLSACGALDVPIELPPHWGGLSAKEVAIQKTWLRTELRRREEAIKAERIAQGLPRPKAARCLELDPFERPARPDRRPPPLCFAASIEATKAFAKVRRAFVAAFMAASAAFRAGVLDVMFPAGAFPPRLTRPPCEAG